MQARKLEFLDEMKIEIRHFLVIFKHCVDLAGILEFAFLRRRHQVMNFLNNKIEIHHIISVVGTYMNICHIVCLTALLLRPRIFCSSW